jgi:hypothetical protein
MAFTHGIGGQYSGKCPQYFARITFVGKPDGLEIKPEDIPGMSEEDKEFGLMEIIDLSDEAVVKTFEAENAGVDFVTEGEESFMRITSFAVDDNVPYVFSNKYPKRILAGSGDHVVVKYRTSFADGDELGILFRTVNNPEYNLDMCYSELIGTDGEWHTVIFYMTEEASWNHFILNLGLAPFYYADDTAQETMDIAWIKFYQEDPYDLYFESEYDPDGKPGKDEDTTAADEETSAPADETQPPEDATQAPDGTATEAPAETEPEKKGCGSSIGFGVAAVLSAMAAAVALKKKD